MSTCNHVITLALRHWLTCACIRSLACSLVPYVFLSVSNFLFSLTHACMHACMHARTHAHTHTYTNIGIHARICTYKHVWMHERRFINCLLLFFLFPSLHCKRHKLGLNYFQQCLFKIVCFVKTMFLKNCVTFKNLKTSVYMAELFLMINCS